jgi:hypothetical protein
LSITFLENFDVRVRSGEDDSDISLSITFLETVDVRVKTDEDISFYEDGTKNAFYTSSRYRTTELLLEDTDNWNITSRSPDAYSYVHGSLKGRSNSKCVYEAMDKTPSIRGFHCLFLSLRLLMCV